MWSGNCLQLQNWRCKIIYTQNIIVILLVLFSKLFIILKVNEVKRRGSIKLTLCIIKYCNSYMCLKKKKREKKWTKTWVIHILWNYLFNEFNVNIRGPDVGWSSHRPPWGVRHCFQPYLCGCVQRLLGTKRWRENSRGSRSSSYEGFWKGNNRGMNTYIIF